MLGLLLALGCSIGWFVACSLVFGFLGCLCMACGRGFLFWFVSHMPGVLAWLYFVGSPVNIWMYFVQAVAPLLILGEVLSVFRVFWGLDLLYYSWLFVRRCCRYPKKERIPTGLHP